MSLYSNTACIVYPARWPDHGYKPQIKDLHSTVIYLGDIDFNLNGLPAQDLLDILKPVDTNILFYARPLKYSAFGPDKSIPVLELLVGNEELLMTTQQNVVDALLSEGIESASPYPYRPHVTVDLETVLRPMPRFVLLEHMELWYGEHTYNLTTGHVGTRL